MIKMRLFDFPYCEDKCGPRDKMSPNNAKALQEMEDFLNGLGEERIIQISPAQHSIGNIIYTVFYRE